MKRVLKFIDDYFEEIVGVIVLAALVTMIFVGVMMRLVFKAGLPWQTELSRIFYVLVVYLGASYGIKTQDHIRMTVILDILPPKASRVLQVFTDVVWAAFNVVIIILSMNLYSAMERFLGRSAVLEIPLHYIFLTVPVGFALLTLRLIQSYIRGEALSAAPGRSVEEPDGGHE